MKIEIGRREIGDDAPPYFVADIAANHDGDLKRALRLIELAKEAGADAAKFQNFQAPKIVSRKGFESLGRQLSHQSDWNKSVYEVYQDASIPFGWTKELKKTCDKAGIEYFSSPYDFESVDLITPYVNVYKIGSGDITWLEMLKYIAAKNKPIIFATGASAMKDVERAMAVLSSFTKDIVLMQCNTNYTVGTGNFKYLNLNVLKTYKKYFPDVILGLSDHTPGYAAVLGAIALGARVFEKHFTDDTRRSGPDHKFSLTPKVWRKMVDYSNQLYQSLGKDIKKIEANEEETVVLQRRALRFTRDLPKGYILHYEDLFPLRPCPEDAVAPYDIEGVVGKKLVNGVLSEDHVRWLDLEGGDANVKS